MELRLASLLLSTLLTLLTSEVTPSLGQKVYTNTWAVHITGGEEEANRLARKHDFINHGNIFGDYYHFRHRRVVKRSLSEHRGTHIRLHREPQVCFPQSVMYNSNHRDLNVKEAWKQGVTGKGVVVSILDDGIEMNHPDLERNYVKVAAVANNDICGVGVAYNAKIGGVRMLDGEVTDAVEAQSLSLNPQHIDIYSASWGPEDDGKTVDGPAKLAKDAFLRGVTEGRGGLGSIFVWASGNGGREKDSCNCDGYTNSIYTLSISSSTQYGNVPWYSEACSSTLATTYSSGGLNEKQIAFALGVCIVFHNGVSAAKALFQTIQLCLCKNLTWRDMQHLVVRTSNPAHLTTDDWRTNGVGRKVSHSYGYGLLDAAAIVALAKNWTNVGPQQKCVLSLVSEPKNIGSHLVISKNVDSCAGKPNFVSSLEHAQAQLTLSYNRRGNLAIYLISPQGTRSTLLAGRPHDYSSEGFNDWAFMTTHSWDEDPRGEWTLEIENKAGLSDFGTLTQFTLILYGTASSSGGPSTADSSQTTDGSCKTYDLNQICTECNPGFYLFQKGCVQECPTGYAPVTTSSNPFDNKVNSVLHPICLSCHSLCLTCSGTGPQDCLSCPPHSHLDPVSNTCLHQNQIQRESPDGGLDQQVTGVLSGILRSQHSSSLPAVMAVLSCAFIMATFVGVFGLLQWRSRGLNKLYSTDTRPGSIMRSGFGLGHSGIVSYKGIPSVWHEDGFNSESDNDEFDVHNERTAFIKTQSAL
uniref:Furin (paired basic amino acid cleaving enzyme) a n=1 Tax=Astyanax mexicanus TaxID=7994 RepID=A0A8B9RGT0_ASTMX